MDFESNSQSFRLLSPDISIFKKAVKESIRIQVLSWHRLTGGVSEAEVYRVFARIAYPRTRFPRKYKKIVIKFSDQRLFKIERKKFKSLPRELKKYFAKFDVPRQQVDGWSFLIMPYLEDFDTLEKILFREESIVQIEELTSSLFENLAKLQFSAGGLNRNFPRLIAHRLYFSSIENSFLKVLDIWRKLQEEVSLAIKVFKKLSKKAEDFEPPFTTRMHGDCHSRNIMINLKNMSMKFIDIDALEVKGDYILDFGELTGDLKVYAPTRFCRDIERNSLPRSSASAQKAVDLLLGRLKDFALSHDDSKWRKRLYLAQTRFLLNILPTIDPGEDEKALYILSRVTDAMNQAAQM